MLKVLIYLTRQRFYKTTIVLLYLARVCVHIEVNSLNQRPTSLNLSVVGSRVVPDHDSMSFVLEFTIITSNNSYC